MNLSRTAMLTGCTIIAALCALTLSSFAAETALGTAPELDCGSPSDIHDGWVIGSAEQQGLDPALLCAMGKGVADGKLPNVDSIVVVRHGVLVYERYFAYPHQRAFDATTKHVGNSMTKSVVSLLVGIAIDRGLIKDLDAPIFPYFPENADLRAPEKDRITLRHLLTMSAGLNSTRAPGISFEYDDGETELIGAILHRVSGKPVNVLAQENIFTPLGIKDVAWYDGTVSGGFAKSSSGLSLRPRDWAKIGQLVLNGGVWEGKQIVPASWIAQSTTAQIKAREPFSYGFQWWIGRSLNEDRAIEWTAALGFNAQKTIIIPDLDSVVVFNASRQSARMIAPEIELLDKYVLPAILKHQSKFPSSRPAH